MTFINSGITAVNKEQLAGTKALISCTATGLTKKLDDVKWTSSNNLAITSGQDGYTFNVGDFISIDGSQTTTLTVAGARNNLDTTYNCLITSTEHSEKDKKTVVILKTFSEFAFLITFFNRITISVLYKDTKF